MTTGTGDRVLKNVAIRFRSDAGRTDAMCTITHRNDEVLIEVDPEVPNVPLRILGRRVEPRVYQGLAVGPDGELLSARWADVGTEQVGIVTGEGYDCLFTLGGMLVELGPHAARPKPPRKARSQTPDL